jgi:glycosyltransferase involved in cell wall biosynthesis
MAVYNGSSFILPQLLSILSQINADDELIIVDDYSEDRSIDIIKEIDDKRIKIIKNSRNMGVIRSFETAISACVGEYVFLCDQDDVC